MPSTRSAGRAKAQKAKEERLQRQQDRTAERIPAPPCPVSSPAESDMLSLFGSIMHGVHCASRQFPVAPRPQPEGQWLLTESFYQSPNGLKPENITARHHNNTSDDQRHITLLPDVSVDGVPVNQMVVFFVGLLSKAEKAVAEVEGKRGSPIDHLRAFLKAFKKDFQSYTGPKRANAERFPRVRTSNRAASTPALTAQVPTQRSAVQAPVAAGASKKTGPSASSTTISTGLPKTRSATRTVALPITSSVVGNHRPAADMPPSSIRPGDKQPQRKTAQHKAKRGLIVRLKVRAFPGGNNPSAGSSSSLNAVAITTRKRKATEEPAVHGAPTSKRPRAAQVVSSGNAALSQANAGPVRRSGRKASITMPPQSQTTINPQQESLINAVSKPGQLGGSLSEATSSSTSRVNKRKAPTGEASDDEFVAEQPKKRRRAAASQSKANKATSQAPRTAAVKKPTKTARTTATAAAPSTTSSPAPTPAPTAKSAAPQPRQRNGAGPATGRNGFELIGPEPRFTLGQNDAALLTLHFYRNDEAGNRVRDSHTWRGKTDDRTPADVDWNSPKDIKILNKWVLQYLNRTWRCNGLRPDMMARVWMDEEFEWLAHQARHYYSWSKADMPSQREKTEEFNEEWEGEQIPYINMEGKEVVTLPRPERTSAAISSAMRRDEEAHPARWVGTYLEDRSKVKREGAKAKEREDEEEDEL